MKKIIGLIMILCLAALGGLHAQTEKGKLLLGVSSRTSLGLFNLSGCSPDIMSVGFTTVKYKSDEYSDDEKEKYTSLNLSPRIGYFLVKNLALGVDLNLAYMKVGTTASDETDKYTTFSAGPFARYYIPAGKVYPFVEAGAAFGSIVYNFEGSEYGDEKIKYGLTLFNGGAGIAVPIGNRASFDTMISYNSMTTKDKEDNPDNGRTIAGTFGIRFGFMIFLGN